MKYEELERKIKVKGRKYERNYFLVKFIGTFPVVALCTV
jgi:hypothetical protein